MISRLKGFILFFIILIPLFISLFLHNFGNNKFDVPIYYQEKFSNNSSCSNQIYFPYFLISDSVLEIGKKLIIIDIRFNDKSDLFTNNQIKRLLNNDFVLDIYSISSHKLDLRWKTINFRFPDLNKYVSCKLLYNTNSSFIVLIDKLGRIRGYYDSNSEEEFDRLSAELKILNNFKKG